jgi:sec-independent protein translocase protein TatB
MLDFGWAEFIVIALIALVIIGPKDIPRLMYQAGKLFRRLHYMKFALSQQFDSFMEKADANAAKFQDAEEGGVDQQSSDVPSKKSEQDLKMDESNPYFVKGDDESDLDGDLDGNEVCSIEKSEGEKSESKT